MSISTFFSDFWAKFINKSVYGSLILFFTIYVDVMVVLRSGIFRIDRKICKEIYKHFIYYWLAFYLFVILSIISNILIELPDSINKFLFFSWSSILSYLSANLLWIAISKYYVWKQFLEIRSKSELRESNVLE